MSPTTKSSSVTSKTVFADMGNIKKRNVNLIDAKEKKLAIKRSAPTLSNKQLEESIVNLGLSITNEDK